MTKRKQHLEYKDTTCENTDCDEIPVKTGIHIIPHRQVSTCIIHPNVLHKPYTKPED